MKGLRRTALATPAAAAPAMVAMEPDAQQRVVVPAATLLVGTLRFVGHSTVGDFGGTTTAVSGAMVGGVGLADARGWAEASVASLRTGNGLRDRHMRAALDADRFGAIRCDVTGVRSGAGAAADRASAMLVGTLTIHGVARAVEVPATIVRRAETIRVTSAFTLRLGDYGIDVPPKMLGLLRVRDDVEIHADLRFVAAAP